MTDKLSNYSTTPGSNNAASPDGWPEGQTAGSVNNSDREFAARVREFYEDSQWIDYGHTIVSSTGSSIKLSGDVTATYKAGRAIRVNQSASQDGWVSASAYSAPDTSITITGFTVAAPTQVELGAVVDHTALPNNLSITVASLAATSVAVSGTLTAGAFSISFASVDSITVGTITATEYQNSNGDPFTRQPNLDPKTSGTAASWTWPTGVTVIKVTAIGGGGAGGAALTNASGGGGGGGGTCIKRLSYVSGVDAVTYTVGAAGSASTFAYNGTTYTANAGSAGSTAGANDGGAGGAGGSATGGDINVSGGTGQGGGTATGGIQGGSGGSSMLGYGGGGGRGRTGAVGANGGAASGYGGGGGGGGSDDSGSNASGGSGTAGIVIFEY